MQYPASSSSLTRAAPAWLWTGLSALALVVSALLIALSMGRVGFAALHLAAIVLPLGWAILAPHSFAVALLLVMIVIEPNAFDFTAPLSEAWYQFPLRLGQLFPFEVTPIEVGAVVVLGSLLVRNATGRRERWSSVPVLTLGVPLVVASGLAYGILKGADLPLAYHEVRGLLFTMVAFAITIEVASMRGAVMTRVVLWGTALLAVLLLMRYVFYTRSGTSDVPLEFAYAHESVLFLTGGLVLATALWMAAPRDSARWFLLAHALLMVVATLATGRRSGTLVLLAVGLIMLCLMLRRRPVAATIVGLIAVVCLSGYLAVYWNQTYGALAQPARAIRSQIDPNPRDLSSDTYREIEEYSILVTIESSPAFGVGFGRPFVSTYPLPELSFWPLQNYTTHQNVLWLWLKMGIVGIATILAVWLIAFGRAVRSFTTAARDGPMPVLPVVLASMFAAYLCFATVDITFAFTRAAAPLGVALALAFTRLPAWTSERTPRDRTERTV